MAAVLFDQVSLLYAGSQKPAVDQLSLKVSDGEFLVLVGPSGCGKTTSLRMLAGLEEVSSGRILIGEKDATHAPPKDRNIAMVFQNYALYPHMTAAENIGFSLKIQGVPKNERLERVHKAAQMLDLEKQLNRRPKELSGGQRQRVAMGRAIVRNPQVFLMDEPLSNLDAKLRSQTRAEITSLTRRLGVTTIYVTHDQVEAMTMGDRVAVLNNGVLQQVDTPNQLYNHPNNLFVAGFIGSPAMNLIKVPADSTIQLGGYPIPVPRTVLDDAMEDTVIMGIRPTDIEVILPVNPETAAGISLTADTIEELGADTYIYGRAAAYGEQHAITLRIQDQKSPRQGDTLFARPKEDRLHFFDPRTGHRLGR